MARERLAGAHSWLVQLDGEVQRACMHCLKWMVAFPVLGMVAYRWRVEGPLVEEPWVPLAVGELKFVGPILEEVLVGGLDYQLVGLGRAR